MIYMIKTLQKMLVQMHLILMNVWYKSEKNFGEKRALVFLQFLKVAPYNILLRMNWVIILDFGMIAM